MILFCVKYFLPDLMFDAEYCAPSTKLRYASHNVTDVSATSFIIGLSQAAVNSYNSYNSI